MVSCPTTGPLSIILWLHSGCGEIHGGHFCLPSLGLKFLPMDCTILVLNAAFLKHGTAPLEVPATSGAVRLGSSLFLRVSDVQALAHLAAGSGVEGKRGLEALQYDILDAMKKKKEAAQKKANAQKKASMGGSVRGGRVTKQSASAAAQVDMKTFLTEFVEGRKASIAKGRRMGADAVRQDLVVHKQLFWAS